MSAEDEFDCQSCGSSSCGVFVQHGSYFTRCLACRQSGWATSWLALSAQISSPVRAMVVDEQFNEIEDLGEGAGAAIIAKISHAAHQGKVVQLLAPKNDA